MYETTGPNVAIPLNLQNQAQQADLRNYLTIIQDTIDFSTRTRAANPQPTQSVNKTHPQSFCQFTNIAYFPEIKRAQAENEKQEYAC